MIALLMIVLETIVIERTEGNLRRLQKMFGMTLVGLVSAFMVFGGAIPYVPQYFEIQKRRSARGFSLHVCLALCVANILRVMFWFGKYFEIILLVQSVVMVACMLLMLEISVRMNSRMTPPEERKSIWNGDLFKEFWKWHDFSSFVVVLLGLTVLSGVTTFFLNPFPAYVEALGFISVLVEAFLAFPQLVRNCQQKSTEGMSIGMAVMWLLDDIGKAIYVVVRKVPSQFWICAFLQITIDLLVLGQVWFYNREESRIPLYTQSQLNKKTLF